VLELPLIAEAQRQFEVCNACRYCEGVCAVFPALERRSVFNEGDISYLANLCHDCRTCLYVCPYAPPHEFAINIPTLMSGVREQTYAGYSWPGWLGRWVDRSLGRALALALAAVIFVLAATILGSGIDRLVAVHDGPESFYAVVPWLAMVLPFMAISLYAIAVMASGGWRFWRDTGKGGETLDQLRPLLMATWEAMTLRYLRGGGPGCNYPDERPSFARLLLHSLVFYGFVSAFVSTVLAAIYQDLLGILPPYDLLSAPVLFGAAGGVAMIIGGCGLLALKLRSDQAPTHRPMRTMDLAFLVVLILVNISGMTLLALRTTAAMGILLNLHLGLTAALFLTLPYGKFVHLIYRYLALVRNRLELRRDPIEG